MKLRPGSAGIVIPRHFFRNAGSLARRRAGGRVVTAQTASRGTTRRRSPTEHVVLYTWPGAAASTAARRRCTYHAAPTPSAATAARRPTARAEVEAAAAAPSAAAATTRAAERSGGEAQHLRLAEAHRERADAVEAVAGDVGHVFDEGDHDAKRAIEEHGPRHRQRCAASAAAESACRRGAALACQKKPKLISAPRTDMIAREASSGERCGGAAAGARQHASGRAAAAEVRRAGARRVARPELAMRRLCRHSRSVVWYKASSQRARRARGRGRGRRAAGGRRRAR